MYVYIFVYSFYLKYHEFHFYFDDWTKIHCIISHKWAIRAYIAFLILVDRFFIIGNQMLIVEL